MKLNDVFRRLVICFGNWYELSPEETWEQARQNARRERQLADDARRVHALDLEIANQRQKRRASGLNRDRDN